ncbi:hypothetical protein SARC_00381 [Sphaeroforma arctica JP610]|uniref:Uncharacterized protein n=1 Tax=Sphaeroforma arctica JP610 TaxID=667725 RepID=A0A0L0GEQ0_9EUKA|nr:hypothetical protein SARC_00381 [Sphaeroforma arctica JP610]KNC87495.1 hypothetical protein SARC_00381 [Sphaeroforma arctica JP610]|eukprot:XP_014161397.1 hypothetical protein SARC_00381 [Sphaeroforma arctica JP610]
MTNDLPGHIPTTSDAWLKRLDDLEKTILPKLRQKTIKYTDAMAEATDQLRKFDLIEFKAGDVVILLAQGATTKAMKPLLGPYVIHSRENHSYHLRARDGSKLPELRDRPVNLEIIRLVHRATKHHWMNLCGGGRFDIST